MGAPFRFSKTDDALALFSSFSLSEASSASSASSASRNRSRASSLSASALRAANLYPAISPARRSMTRRFTASRSSAFLTMARAALARSTDALDRKSPFLSTSARSSASTTSEGEYMPPHHTFVALVLADFVVTSVTSTPGSVTYDSFSATCATQDRGTHIFTSSRAWEKTPAGAASEWYARWLSKTYSVPHAEVLRRPHGKTSRSRPQSFGDNEKTACGPPAATASSSRARRILLRSAHPLTRACTLVSAARSADVSGAAIAERCRAGLTMRRPCRTASLRNMRKNQAPTAHNRFERSENLCPAC